MALVYANEEEKQKGWTLSLDFLKAIQQKVIQKMVAAEEYDGEPSLDHVEEILLAYEELSTAQTD